MSKIKIILKGLAVCYSKNDGADGRAKWRVIFPIDRREHRLFFSANGEAGPFEELAAPGRVIRLETANGKRPDKPRHDDFENSAFNMKKSFVHPSIRMKRGWQEKAVIMYLDNAKFHVHERVDRDFYLTFRQLPIPSFPFGRNLGRIA